uniref:erythropoietin receptor-like n=1 Tax=Podarcis muralis TaxID=64176 RepID=UPI00109FF849|nr:erythropoietin receptor-like [Podarcis muralis]
MDNSIRYEMAIFHKGSIVQRVEISNGQTYYLRNLKGGTRYTLAVRAKPNGVSFDGFWSGWSQTASAMIPSGKCSSGNIGRSHGAGPVENSRLISMERCS